MYEVLSGQNKALKVIYTFRAWFVSLFGIYLVGFGLILLRQLNGAWNAQKGKLLAQGEVWIALPHENAPQVRMAGEGDTEHVIRFPLVPVCRGKVRREAGHFRLLTVLTVRRDADVPVRCAVVKMIDAGEARQLHLPVNRRHVQQKVITVVVTQLPRKLRQAARRD